MNTELRLHGHITDDIEYYATAAGCRTTYQNFFHTVDDNLRFFAPGNELLLTSKGLKQSGTGGSFCEYMFGVDQPLSDLTKPGIVNRLMLLGVRYDQTGQLKISHHNDSTQSYADIFTQGHAIDNYYFFVDGLKGSTHPARQEEILRCIGKTLKRMNNLNRQDDSQLTQSLLALLPEQSTIFLVRLSHARNRHFQQEFQSLYYRDRTLSEQAIKTVKELAVNLKLDRYQKERICVDVMYRHRDNYRIIDDYKKILTECFHQGDINKQQHAHLTRLKTLALRNEIPAVLLTTLDEKLQSRIRKIAREPEYTAVTRAILHDLMRNKNISNRDMIQLLFAKQNARQNHDHSFELLLLESGQLFDEQIRDGAPLSLLEDFSHIITFFDRYDSTSTSISKIAFMEHFNPTENLLRNLLESRQEFNNLAKGLFNKLFFEELLNSRYLGAYGRKKTICLHKGLDEIAAGISTPSRLEAELRIIDNEEKLYMTALETTKKRIRTRYSRYNTRSEQQELLEELSAELMSQGKINRKLDPDLFQRVIHDIKKEALYLRNLLPEIIANNDIDLRIDFFSNSGLDHFYIEELEREYFVLNQIDLNHLQRLRSKSI